MDGFLFIIHVFAILMITHVNKEERNEVSQCYQSMLEVTYKMQAMAQSSDLIFLGGNLGQHRP